MKQYIHVENREELIGIDSNVVYMQESYWCNASVRQLRMSIIRPRHWYDYDHLGRKSPVIMFYCGGAFGKQDVNVWNAELAYFAKRGYAVATVEYDTYPYTKWPTQLNELKAAVRYLRAHKEEFDLNTDQITVMGESAGGYLAAAMAVTNGRPEYDTVGGYKQESSDVQAAVCWWPCIDMSTTEELRGMDTRGFPNLVTLVNEDTPPFFLMHGTKDHLVSCRESEMMADTLDANNVYNECYIVEGADHADMLLMQDEMKERIIHFMHRVM